VLENRVLRTRFCRVVDGRASRSVPIGRASTVIGIVGRIADARLFLTELVE
jgi:hypothetical protein